MVSRFYDYLAVLGLQTVIEEKFRDELSRVVDLIINQNDQQKEIIMALNEAVNRLTAEVTTQMQQTADALNGLQEAVDNLSASQAEKEALQAALDQAVASNESAAAAINAQSDVLASDNPPAPEEPEPEPEPDTPVEPSEQL